METSLAIVGGTLYHTFRSTEAFLVCPEHLRDQVLQHKLVLEKYLVVVPCRACSL
jgi:hypothetical protein